MKYDFTKANRFNLGDEVRFPSYYENEIFVVTGIRENELELAGDWSGGTHNVYQKSWVKIDKVVKV